MCIICCLNCCIITSMTHKCFPVGIPKRQEFCRHGNKLVAAPCLWNVTTCGQEELWVFLSSSVTLLFFFFHPSLPLDQKMWQTPSFPFCPPVFCTLPSLWNSVVTSVFVRQPVISQNQPPIANIPLLPTDTPMPIILSPLFLLAWYRWLLSQLIWLCLCS